MRLLWLLLLTAPLRGEEEFLNAADRDAFLDRVSETMNSITAFAAAFDQEKELKVFRDKVKSTGVIVFARPDKLRWEIAEPFRSILIVVGNDAAKFEWVGGKRRALRLGRSKDAIVLVMERIRGWFRGEFKKARKDYTVEVTAGKDPRIVMWPKDKRLRKTLQRLEFWPTRDLKAMRRVIVHEGNGGVTVMKFRDHRHGIQPKARIFDLKDPAEVDLKKLRDAR